MLKKIETINEREIQNNASANSQSREGDESPGQMLPPVSPMKDVGGDWWNRVVYNPWDKSDRDMIQGLHDGVSV